MDKPCGYFKGKKITLIGLGLLGRGVGVAEFLAECGADLIVTDLKKENELAPPLKRLSKHGNIKFVLGRHRLCDFRGRDMVIKAAGVPTDSPYIAEARRRGIPVKMDASLFAELAPGGVTIIGITGTRGKSTTTHLIYEILSEDAKRGIKNRRKICLGGNVRGIATLPLLRKIRPGDVVVMELDSWQLEGFGEIEISPRISVFTTFYDDHLNYYKNNRKRYLADKANIFKFQGADSKLIVGSQAAPVIYTNYPAHAKRAFVAGERYLPKSWKLKIPGEHNRYNAALALAAADAFSVPRSVSKKVIETFPGLSGRLQFVGEIKGVKIYNDTCATTPEAAVAALRALGNAAFKSKKIVLIAGGTDKGLNMSKLIREIPKYCKAAVFIAGTGTEKLLAADYGSYVTKRYASSLKDALVTALYFAERGDMVIFSPAFTSFGMFKNEYDRGAKFDKIVKALA